MAITTLLCDLDGVLGNFDKALCDLFEKPAPPPEASDLLVYLGVDRDEMWRKIRASDSFWSSLPVLPAAHTLWRSLKGIGPTKACTSYGKDLASATPKLEWLERHQFYSDSHVLTTDKTICVAKSHLLLDDTDENVDSFRSAGGKAVLFPTRWNSSRFQGSHAEAVKLAMTDIRKLATA